MSFLFPNKCVACGEIIEDGVSVCENCRKTLYRIDRQCCKYCGRDIPLCGCLGKNNYFFRNVSVFRYDGSAGKIVKRYKMGKITQISVYICKELSMLISEAYRDVYFDCMTFVPVSRVKKLFRGFDHAELIAKGVSEILGLENTALLKRRFSFKPQKSLHTKEKRQKNIYGKFRAMKNVKGKTILLIDDVMTTGSTLNECARVLKAAGAADIFCATFAATYKK